MCGEELLGGEFEEVAADQPVDRRISHPQYLDRHGAAAVSVDLQPFGGREIVGNNPIAKLAIAATPQACSEGLLDLMQRRHALAPWRGVHRPWQPPPAQ